MSRLLVILVFVSVGCHAAAPPRSTPKLANPAMEPMVRVAVSGPLQRATRAADVAEFKPAVPAVDTGGHCESVPLAYPMLKPGQRPLHYSFGTRSQPLRNVTLIVDSLGNPVRYSDLRGDLRGNPDPVVAATMGLGTRTSISINLSEQTGVLRNAGAGVDSVGLRVSGPQLLVASNIGTPNTMIARILRECATSRR